MLNQFDTHPLHNDTAAISLDLTASELATSLIPVLIGMASVAVIAVLMLL